MIEEWKTIPGFVGLYEASNLGRIKSIPRKLTRPSPRNQNKMQTRWYGGGILRAHEIKSGGSKFPYLTLTLSKDRIQYKFLVHRLVLMAFIGECPLGMQGCHNDGNGLNNAIENLRWDTPSNNQLDRKKHGTEWAPVMKGEDHPGSKLLDKDIIYIRSVPPYKNRAKDLANKFNITKNSIHQIIGRRSWKHVEE